MLRHEVIAELKLREAELIDELDAIRKIIKSNTVDDSSQKQAESMKGKATGETDILPKGNMSWKEYIKIILEKIGGIAKKQQVAKEISRINPGISEKTVFGAVNHNLSLLYKKGEIGAKVGKLQTDGYEYYIIKDKE